MKIKRSTLILWKKRLVLSFIIMGVFSVFYIYFKTPTFTITAYELVGVPDMYKDTIDNNLRIVSSQKIYKIIPGDKILSYSSKSIKKSIVETLPNTKKITILPIGFHTLRIKVTHYDPLFKVDDVHGVTKEGVIYTEFKDMSNLPKISFASSTMKEVINDGILSVVVDETYSDKLISISSFVNKINSVVFVVSKIQIDEYNDVVLYDDRGISRIMFSLTSDIDKVWSNIVSAIDTDPLKSQLLNNKDKLEYLDARFGNKVFYKFTNNLKTAIIENHEATTTSSTTLPQ